MATAQMPAPVPDAKPPAEPAVPAAEAGAEKDGAGDGVGGGAFECNICLELASEPVITMCGHLYCWPCLFRWIQVDCVFKQCPVCKAGVDEDKMDDGPGHSTVRAWRGQCGSQEAEGAGEPSAAAGRAAAGGHAAAWRADGHVDGAGLLAVSVWGPVPQRVRGGQRVRCGAGNGGAAASSVPLTLPADVGVIRYYVPPLLLKREGHGHERECRAGVF